MPPRGSRSLRSAHASRLSSCRTSTKPPGSAHRPGKGSAGSLGRLERKLRRLKLHRICAPEAMSALSRLNTRSSFLEALHNAGRAQADAWLMEYLARDAQERGARLSLALFRL